ncbi:MAG TPA: phosphohydrolase, partial [Gammaproteobacteria bacterium]|nr:phosphohydrolase [Gammaproteobacteria bacterium]
MSDEFIAQVEKLTSIGISLSQERNLDVLLEKILIGAKDITYSDGGTLYLVKGKQLNFEIIRTDSLGFAMGGTTNNAVTLPPIPIYNENNKPNLKNISAYAAATGTTVNIADAYDAEGFDFAGVKEFDKRNHFRSVSFLTVPMKN